MRRSGTGREQVGRHVLLSSRHAGGLNASAEQHGGRRSERTEAQTGDNRILYFGDSCKGLGGVMTVCLLAVVQRVVGVHWCCTPRRIQLGVCQCEGVKVGT